MQRFMAILLTLLATQVVAADAIRTVPQHVLDSIVDDDPFPLPRYMTSAELDKAEPIPLAFEAALTAPTGDVYCPPEYAHNDGMLIRWGSFNDVLTEMTVGITTGDPDAIIYIVVANASQQNSAEDILDTAGADMDQVEFLIADTDSVWIRDYGPRFIREGTNRAIIDHEYYSGRPNDNAIPVAIGAQWGDTVHHIGLSHGGGNFHLFTDGTAFMTELVLGDNPGITEAEVISRYQQYQNVDLTITDGFPPPPPPPPTSIDGTRHIDMWMLPVDDNSVIIGQYTGSSSYPAKQITDDVAADLSAQGYTVYRTPGWNSGSGGFGGTHYTYTNAVVMNDVVAIPRFGGAYTSEDAQALATFQTAFPDRTVFTVDCSEIIDYAGAIHCIVMHVPRILSGMLVTPDTEFAPMGDLGGPFSPGSTVYTVNNYSDAPLDYTVTTIAPWLDLTNATGTLAPGASANVTLTVNSSADALGYGAYIYPVNFTNLTDGEGNTQRSARLTVQAPPPVITTTSLPDGTAGEPYGPVQLTHDAGQPVVTWSLAPTLDYAETDLGTSGFAPVTSTPTYHGDDNTWAFDLDFDFPFYDQEYSQIRVSANGFINFGSINGSVWQNSTALLISNRRIAPLWDDLKMYAPQYAVHVDQSVPDQVTVRWQGATLNGSHPVDFSATLFANGNILMHFGPGNATVSATSGISAGDGTHYTLSPYNGQTSFAGATSLLYTQLDSLPEGLSLSSDGVISGVPIEEGAFMPVVRVKDSIDQSDQQGFSLDITSGVVATGDRDMDGDVDLVDFAALQTCMGPVDGECSTTFNFVLDAMIDTADAAEFMNVLNGPQ